MSTAEGLDLSTVSIERVLPDIQEGLPIKDLILRLMREDTAYEYQKAQFFAWKLFISTGEFPPSNMFWTKPTNIKRAINGDSRK